MAITTRNRPEALVRCLASLQRIDDLIGEVVIGDDQSDPPAERCVSDEAVQELRDRIRVVRHRASIGQVALRSGLVREARFPWVLSLDDDACIIDGHAVRKAVATLTADDGLGAIAFAQAEADGHPWPAAMQPSRGDDPCYVTAFIGFATLLRRDVFQRLGGFRDLFVFYGEEKEFCLRLLEAGYAVVYLPDARVAHLPAPGGRDGRIYLRQVARNDCLSALYNDPWWRLVWMLPARFVLYLRMRRVWGIEDRGGLLWLIREVLRVIPRMWPDRRPLRSATFRRWRQLRRSPPYPGAVLDTRATDRARC